MSQAEELIRNLSEREEDKRGQVLNSTAEYVILRKGDWKKIKFRNFIVFQAKVCQMYEKARRLNIPSYEYFDRYHINTEELSITWEINKKK